MKYCKYAASFSENFERQSQASKSMSESKCRKVIYTVLCWESVMYSYKCANIKHYVPV